MTQHVRTAGHTLRTRMLSLTLAAALAAGCALPAAAAEPAGDGVTPTYDEAYYATLDYYGGLTEGSVVKSYALNGSAGLTDYGVYDEVVNLTDGTVPTVGSGSAVFRFGEEAPSHFYFEGKTRKPFENLPWTLSLRYTLNGVPTRAEDLAGKQGVVEILLDAVPNEHAGDYARYNYTLAAAAMFNQDDILSLEAPGAQVQLVGNLRTVLFMVLPGEERHFSIRVGSDAFTFGGMTMLMVPATLAQLEEISKLSQRKDDLEEDYRALSGSLDNLLDALSDIQGGLYASASGLDQLDAARRTVSGGKGTIYDGTDRLRGDLTGIADLLEPVQGQVLAISQLVTDSKTVLNDLTDTAISLQTQLKDLESALSALEEGSDDVRSLLRCTENLKYSLSRLQDALGGTPSIPGLPENPGSAIEATVDKVKAVHSAYEERDRQTFYEKMLVIQGESPSAAAEKAGKAAQLAAAGALDSAEAKEQVILALAFQAMQAQAPGLTQEQFAALLAAGDPAAVGAREAVAREVEAQLPGVRQLEALYQAAGALSFQKFCEKLPGVTPEQAKQMNDLWIVYNSGSLETGRSKAQSLSGALLLNDPADGESAGDSGKEPSGDSTKEPAEDSGKEPAEDSGKEPSGDSGKEPPADSTKEPSGDSTKEPSGDSGKEPAGDSGKEPAEDGTKEPAGDNTKEPSGDSAKEPSGDSGKEPSGDNAKEPSGDSGKEPPADSTEEPSQPPHESGSVGGAVVDLITGSLDSASSQINQIQNQLTGAMRDIAGPTAEVVGDLADLCGQMDDLTELLDDAGDVSAALRNASHKIRDILGETDNLRNLLNDYEPILQETLNTVGGLSAAAASTVRDMESLAADAEALLKTSGEQLDAGARQSLSGLSSALRQTARALGTTGDVREAKDAVTGIVEDVWHEYTGDVNNLLLMDAGAEPVSLTDSRNPAPASIQILLRTQEIQTEKAETEAESAPQAEADTFWDRVVRMFRDFWSAITGIFR
ncbi:hypothetical protein [uncultured Oscillibacter sp.]|uniref:hypothetical protein n=1 Tax=uncultured Oscillibacter sp. TaxID=876091 RepID=UPI00260184BB|nr:hypothetical protein [uncultured Oscillibacter sp.]